VCVSAGAQEGRGRVRREGLERANQRRYQTHKDSGAKEAQRCVRVHVRAQRADRCARRGPLARGGRVARACRRRGG
jgi:hypothetical protein